MWPGLGWWSLAAQQRWDFILIIFGCGYVIAGLQCSCIALVKEDYFFTTCHISGSHAHVALKEVCVWFLSPAVGHFLHVCIPPKVPVMATNFSAVLPGRLWDGPSSPCRLQDTSCWAPPATLSTSCRRSRQQRLWACLRRAGSGSCRVCCWEELHSCDRLAWWGWRKDTSLTFSCAIFPLLSCYAPAVYQEAALPNTFLVKGINK